MLIGKVGEEFVETQNCYIDTSSTPIASLGPVLCNEGNEPLW